MTVHDPDKPAPSGEQVDKILGLLGLAHRAGRLALGASAVESLVHKGTRPVVIIAQGIGRSQRRRYQTLRPVRGFIDGLVGREDLAQRMGRQELAVVAVADNGIVSGLKKLDVVTTPPEDSAASR